jgi:hypothetical protein
VGPCLLPDRPTVQRYRDFLETVLPGLVKICVSVRQMLWFRHDGAPARCGADVRQWLNTTYAERWIRRRGGFRGLLRRPI